jgi:hypothetical protein
MNAGDRPGPGATLAVETRVPRSIGRLLAVWRAPMTSSSHCLRAVTLAGAIVNTLPITSGKEQLVHATGMVNIAMSIQCSMKNVFKCFIGTSDAVCHLDLAKLRVPHSNN